MTIAFEPTAQARIEEYLSALRAGLRDLPDVRRAEVLADIEDHLDDALLDTGAADADAVSALLAQLGRPEEIAMTAHAEFAASGRARPASYDVVAVLVLLLGGLAAGLLLHSSAAAVVGWLAGVVLLWASPTWRSRDKVLAMLFAPVGIGLVGFTGLVSHVLMLHGGDGCVDLLDGGGICNLGSLFPPAVRVALYVGFLLFAVVAPLVTAWRLLRRARPTR